MSSNNGHSLPPSLQKQMTLKQEVSLFEDWWEGSQFSNMITTRPVHDLGLVSMIEEGHGDRATLKDSIRSYLGFDSTEPTSEAAVHLSEFSWSHVFEELRQARLAYEENAASNPFRRCFRHGPAMDRNLRPMLEAIPQDDGLGLIKGGLLLVLNAVQRRSQTCKTIFDTFDSIPRRVWHAESLRRAHTSNILLRLAVDKLYLELTKCLPSLIKILLREDQSRWKKCTKSIYGDSKSEVDDILKPTIAAQARLHECQQELISQNVVDTVELTRLSIREHQETRTFMQKEIQLVQEESDQKMQKQFANLHDKMERDLAEVIRREVRQTMKNSLCEFTSDNERLKAILQGGARPQQVAWTVPLPGTLARRQLIQSLCDQPESEAPSRDRASVLRKYHNFREKALSRANQLLTHPRFRQWIAALHSDILIANGHCGGDITGSTSTISVFCASLVQTFAGPDPEFQDSGVPMSLPQSPRIILEYFSGQYNVCASGLDNPQGMMRSLLYQLVQRWPHGVLLDLQGHQQLYYSRDLSTAEICFLFEIAIAQLPVDFPVWCIIDNVSHFETAVGGWVFELSGIVDCFCRCIQRQQGRGDSAPLKFLLAAANRSMDIWEQIPHNQIDLRYSNVQSQSRGYNVFHGLLES